MLPAWGPGLFSRKISGYERRWQLEDKGFTKEGFFEIFRTRFSLDHEPGLLLELATGDGLVGSLGQWMEKGKCGWKVEAWEHRSSVARQFRRNRPHTLFREGRITDWEGGPKQQPDAITLRGVREAAGVCRAIRKKLIQPWWLGVWNPGRRPVWYRRLRREGYRLELAWQNVEFYLRSPP